jgi:hemerythrin superfamily protein
MGAHGPGHHFGDNHGRANMAKTTIDHNEIRRWVEGRGGHPATVKRTARSADPGILRIDYPGYSGGQSLQAISWEEWFEKFDQSKLAFIYQDRARGGQPSRFSKLIKRETARAKGARVQDPDALQLLEGQHRAVEALFEKLSEGPDGAEFRRTFMEVADMLAIHTTIEERHFYPAVKNADTKAQLQHALEEHLDAKRVLATLLETSQSDRDLMPKLEELAGLVEEHVIEEEHELFPQVRELLDRDQLVALAQEMTATIVELQEEGEPRQHVPQETEGLPPL